MLKEPRANKSEEREPATERAGGVAAGEPTTATPRKELERKRAASRQREEVAYSLEPEIQRSPIEEEDLGDEPLDSAHTDEPVDGKKRTLSAEQKRQLEGKRAASRQREEEGYRLEPSIRRSSFQRESRGR